MVTLLQQQNHDIQGNTRRSLGLKALTTRHALRKTDPPHNVEVLRAYGARRHQKHGGTGDDSSGTCVPAPAGYLLLSAARPPPSPAVRP